MTKNIELGIKIKALVDGLQSVKVLADEIKGLAGQAGQPLPDSTAPLREGAQKTSMSVRDLMGALAGLVSLGAINSFVRTAVREFAQAEAAFRGLEAVANFSGVGIGRAMQVAGELAADGLITTQDASKALQNLLSRGYNIEEAVTTLTRLKDAAAFNRAAALSMGQAVVSATEGLKNENSILVDNAGVTKNVSVMWKEYAAQIGKTVDALTQQDKIQAEVNGILRETEAQMGNAAKAADGLQGQLAKLDSGTRKFNASLGEALTPAVIGLTEGGIWLIENFLKPAVFLAKATGIAFGELAGRIGATWDLIKSGDFSAFSEKIKTLKNISAEMRAEAQAALASGKLAITPLPDSGKRRQPLAGGVAGIDPAAGARAIADGQRLIDASHRYIDALRLETEQIGLNVIQRRLLAAAAEAAKAPTAALRLEIMASAQAWAEATQAQADAVAAGKAGLKNMADSGTAELERLEAQFRATLSRMQVLQDGINIKRQSGLLTEAQARSQISDLLQQTATDLDLLLPKMQALADASGGEAVTRIAGLRNEVARLRIETDQYAVRFAGTVRDSLQGLFQGLMLGQQDVFSSMVQNFKQAMAAMVAEALAAKLMESLFGGLGGFASLGALFGVKTPVKKAGGGLISGPGTGTSDSIPALLSDGEYVLKNAAVRHWGVGLLDSLNSMSRAPQISGGRLAFAGGGLVQAPRGAAGQAPAATNITLSLHPDALHLSLSDWLNGELARISMGGK